MKYVKYINNNSVKLIALIVLIQKFNFNNKINVKKIVI
jgi:hypothetical protein